MQTIRSTRAARAATLAAALALAPAASRADAELEALQQQVEALAAENREMRSTIGSLRQEVQSARDQARSAHDAARAAATAPPASAQPGEPPLRQTSGGGLRLQLMDISLDVLAAAGGSSANDDQLLLLQGGGHDPNQRGFTFQQAELSFVGAIDPWFTGEAHLIYFIDPEGESQFEVEEAFATTTQLPFALHEHGLQLELGQFFTEFGRINPQHPHQWDWQDQPFVLTRFFGADGLRGPGVRAGWLTPLPWFSEVHVGVQNAKGETMTSFLASDEVFEERPVGGRPFADPGVRRGDDLLYLARWVNGVDLSDTVSAQLGFSGVFGPNATGGDGRTNVYGSDLVVKWRPLATDRGWPFVKFQAELLYRDYHADAFFGCIDEDDCAHPVSLDDENLRDWGGYAQLLWGFRRGWETGVRYEYGTGSGESVLAYDGRDADPFRADRHRVSPLLVFHPSEFSRLRLQYSYDLADDLDGDDAHSLWAGIEFLFGAHPAHAY
jgi:hypothetical protein